MDTWPDEAPQGTIPDDLFTLIVSHSGPQFTPTAAFRKDDFDQPANCHLMIKKPGHPEYTLPRKMRVELYRLRAARHKPLFATETKKMREGARHDNQRGQAQASPRGDPASLSGRQ